VVTGTHEDGLNGCCGCVVEMIDGDDEITVVPGADPCRGTIEFAGGKACCWYEATIRVRDLCGTYEDIVSILIEYEGQCFCSCPYQSDYDEDGFLTALDLGSLIDVLFSGVPESQSPSCPLTYGDFDCDCFVTALDLSGLIDHLFVGGPGPCNPCEEPECYCDTTP
jgi:hypothetical protein